VHPALVRESGAVEPHRRRHDKSAERAAIGSVNGFRSLPFIILLVAVIPPTRLIVETSIGTAAAIARLSIVSRGCRCRGIGDCFPAWNACLV
jgi:ABC-type methionine transport system permease subunit